MTIRKALKVLKEMDCSATPDVTEAIYVVANALQENKDWLSLDELRELVYKENNYVGQHIWVCDIDSGVELVNACVLDVHHSYGIVATYGACDEHEWFLEKDYEDTWVAYLEYPG